MNALQPLTERGVAAVAAAAAAATAQLQLIPGHEGVAAAQPQATALGLATCALLGVVTLQRCRGAPSAMQPTPQPPQPPVSDDGLSLSPPPAVRRAALRGRLTQHSTAYASNSTTNRGTGTEASAAARREEAAAAAAAAAVMREPGPGERGEHHHDASRRRRGKAAACGGGWPCCSRPVSPPSTQQRRRRRQHGVEVATAHDGLLHSGAAAAAPDGRKQQQQQQQQQQQEEEEEEEEGAETEWLVHTSPAEREALARFRGSPQLREVLGRVHRADQFYRPTGEADRDGLLLRYLRANRLDLQKALVSETVPPPLN
jgi:hypothetical protein